MKLKMSDVIVDSLVEGGVGGFFVFTGGAISHVIDSLANRSGSDPPYFCFQNEQAAAFAAEAFSRNNGDGLLGASLTTSGPGASNLLSGVAGAWYDCIPAVFVTGQVRTWELGIQKGRLQGGFQELDIVSMAESVTKYAKTLTDPSLVRDEILEAVQIARFGRPGPVLIDIPMDLQFESIESALLKSEFRAQKAEGLAVDNDLRAALDVLNREIRAAKKPLLLIGGGVKHADQTSNLRALVANSRLPTIATYAAADVLGPGDNNYLGVMGQFGNPLANAATGETDLIIALGSRFAQKQLGNNAEGFAPNAKIVSVNVDQAEMAASPRKIDVAITLNLRALLPFWSPQSTLTQTAWSDTLEIKATLDADIRTENRWRGNEGPANPYALSEQLVEAIGSRPCVLAIDVGQNVVASVQKLNFPENISVFSSWGNSPMGYSLPAAIGAFLANPARDVVCVIGDGGLQVNIQELQTIVHYQIPIKILLWNNHAYVTIHEYQDGNLEGRYEATDATHGYSHPNFVAVAQAYGLAARKLEGPVDSAMLERELFESPGPILLEVEVDPQARLSPSVKGSNPIHQMSN